ncbi:MAG: hypothetical protein MJZ75_02610 [Paludibacteraceae bacterium]|nr:hypothetical protein [Paludibacteraceae bacterium]
MKEIWKHIIIITCGVLTAGIVITAMVISHRIPDVPVCQDMSIRLLDANQRQFMATTEIIQLLNEHHINPIGKTMDTVPTQQIEQLVATHPVVRTVECYKSAAGKVHIELTQRMPLLRIVTPAETYFVDTDRKIMPVRPSVQASVICVSGDLNKRFATTEIANLVEWIMQDAYWVEQVERIEVDKGKQIRLIQKNGAAEIIMGSIAGFEHKLGKLRHWYEAGKEWNINQYALVDIQYRGQVIGKQKEEQEEQQ